MRKLRLLTFVAGLVVLSASSAVAQDKWGSLKGSIIMSKPVEGRKIDVTTDKEHCQSKGPLQYEDIVVDSKTKGVKNVVVWLRPDTDDRKDTFPKDKIHPSLAKIAAKNHVIDQPCCQFVPRIIAARAGDTLEVKNSSPVPHNVNFNSDAESFNVTIPSMAAHKPKNALEVQTTPILFKCDIHSWMQGRIRVFDHPYFAVTKEDGTFEIKDAPAGKWRLVVWHEGGFHKGRDGVLGMPVEVTEGKTAELTPVDLQLPVSK
jgi:plastocyanin